jgi:hypothetical protein
MRQAGLLDIGVLQSGKFFDLGRPRGFVNVSLHRPGKVVDLNVSLIGLAGISPGRAELIVALPQATPRHETATFTIL